MAEGESTKRTQAEPSRKSTRGSNASDRLGHPQQEELRMPEDLESGRTEDEDQATFELQPIRTSWERSDDLDDRDPSDANMAFDRLLPQYNNLVYSVPPTRVAAHQEHHENIQRSCDRARGLLAQYVAEVRSLRRALDEGIDAVKASIRGDPYWYTNRQPCLFLAERQALSDMFKDNPVQDPVHFQRFLLDNVRDYLHQTLSPDWQSVNAFTDKMYSLRHALCPAETKDPLLHKLSLHLCASWCAEFAAYDQYDMAEVCGTLRFIAYINFQLCLGTKAESANGWWNIAAVHRQLLRSYEAIECEEVELPLGPGDFECFHYETLPMLDETWDLAYQEVSAGVRIVVEDVLPEELADLVLDWTLVAEGLTSENRFRRFDHKRNVRIELPQSLKCAAMRAFDIEMAE